MFGGAISFSTPHLYLSALAFSPRGSRISLKTFKDRFCGLPTVVSGNSKVWPAVQAVLHQSSGVGSVVFSPDGKYILSGSGDGTLQLWDAETGELVRPPLEGHQSWVQSVAFSPDGKRIVSGSDDKTIRVWDAMTGELVRPPLEGHQGWVQSVAFSPDGKRIVSGSYDNTIRIWDATVGALPGEPTERLDNSVLPAMAASEVCHFLQS